MAVENLHEDVILGFSWIQEQGVVFDSMRKCVYFAIENRKTAYFGPPILPKTVNNVCFELSHIPPEYKNKFQNLLGDFKDNFSDTTQPITRTVKHDIKLISNKIIKIKPYPINDRKKTHSRTTSV